jgi:hypothetical protein
MVDLPNTQSERLQQVDMGLADEKKANQTSHQP